MGSFWSGLGCPECEWGCGENEIASCGGVLRNSSGNWLSGYSKGLDKINILQAEFWGIFLSLSMIKSKTNMKFYVQTGCKQELRSFKENWFSKTKYFLPDCPQSDKIDSTRIKKFQGNCNWGYSAWDQSLCW